MAAVAGVLAVVAAIAVPAADGRGTKTVKVGDDFFSPTTLGVKKGTKVAFKWVGDNKHNIIKKSGPGKDFSSPVTSRDGVQFKHKFKKAGTYKLICTIHDGMKMKIKVSGG